MLALPFLEQLKKAGHPVESIDYVLCTHLHIDHIGWNTRWDGKGWIPTFPNARYLFSRLRLVVPSYQVEDEEGRTHLLIHLPIEEENENRWCLWRPDHAGFDSRSIFEGALIEE